ncbi:YncE family protein [Paraburkholderia sp. SARCC-3016]|uniref:YncE family protein n=1 Tax=Paraburkholderia sp. SARCC-3016 TaxID=3058611 RepID=UPI002807F754|nr:YncE family protein [Paraburkholderia sp. SARCC-3016]MDQ7979886.1 YncE family protein [Paraburkholderia sp. SARCC-3016]
MNHIRQTLIGRLLNAVCTAAIATVLSAGCAAKAADQPEVGNLPLKHVADIPLPGRTSRFDYESYDADRHLLFIAHLGDSEVVVFDTLASRVVTRIPGIAAVHGVLVVPGLSRVYASATGTNEIVAIDEQSLKEVARMPAGDYPDGMAYAPDAHKLYVSDERGATETVIDVSTNRRVATIPLGGEVGNSQYDPVSRHIFVNVQTQSQLVEIDPATDAIVTRIDLPGARGNHGLLIVPQSRLAFVACEDNDHLLVLDMRTMKVAASFDVGGDPDVLAFDPGTNMVYVAGEKGVVSMFSIAGSRVLKLGDGKVGPNAHVVNVDTTTHRAYFPLKSVDGRPVLRVMDPR